MQIIAFPGFSVVQKIYDKVKAHKEEIKVISKVDSKLPVGQSYIEVLNHSPIS